MEVRTKFTIATGYRYSPNYDRLTPEQALRTADCYSQYAFDAAGREFIHKQHEL